MKSPRARLEDILEAVRQIEKQRGVGQESFEENELIQVWMIHHLQVIGEAVRAIDPAFRDKHPQVRWREIAGMRNILVHDYGSVNLNIVWNAVEKHVPELKTEIETILAQLPSESN